MDEKEFKNEESYLNETLSVVKKNISESNARNEEYKNKIIESKKYIWQNLNELNDVEMYSAMNDEDLNVLLINRDLIKTAKLYRSLETPYFGKIVLDGEDIYIGLTGITDNDKNYVYDWRAPISNLYYNTEEENQVDAEGNIIKGKVSLKRQFKIVMGKLINYFDNDVIINDEVLQEMLSNNSDDKMKNIVSTIQKEQNEIIRYKGKNHLIIEGVAGSGKTSVALHRIAYLLYNNPKLTSDNVLIFSPSELFTEYISNVLPDLGESMCFTTTFSDFASSYLKPYKVESLHSFIERYYEGNFIICDDIAKKMSSKFGEVLDKFISRYTKELTFKNSLGFKTRKISKEELLKMLRSTKKEFTFKEKLDYMAEKLCDLFAIEPDKNVPKLSEILAKLLNVEKNPHKLYKLFTESKEYKEFIDKDYIEDDYIHYEDIYGILYLYFEINGYPIESHIGEMIIDEAQDYTLLQFKLIKKIFKSATFTILGDSKQLINPYNRYESLKEISSLFKNSKYMMLEKSYRSSKEIMDYAGKVLGIKLNPVRRLSNNKVIEKIEVNLKEDLIEDIKYLQSIGMKRIAIITKTRKESELIGKLIKDKNVGINKEGMLKSIVILPSYLAKGLEFDAVISYNGKDNFYKENEKELLYVVLTRAEHALIVYNKKIN